MSQSVFPFWFRAYCLIPVLAVFYCVVPNVWDFTPHVLTHSMPYFLVGGSDWGGGNVFAFTKIVYWASMILGAVANCRLALPEAASVRTAAEYILAHHVWHIAAALTLAVGWSLQVVNGETVNDLWLLTAYLFAGMLAIVLTVAATRTTSRRKARTALCVTIGVVWGFIPVGMG
jgi:hypothetical protein